MKTKNTRIETPAGIAPKEYNVIAPLIMASGVGDGKTTACLVAQAATIDALRKGQTLETPTDALECACPLLRHMAIAMNDASWWKSNEERTRHLRPLIPLLLDSRGGFGLIQRRAARYSNAVIHELTPMRLEWIASNTKNTDVANSCRNGIKAISEIEVISDKWSALEAIKALSGLKFSAHSSASADAHAHSSASAAHAYASASADASADASAYSYAYTYAYASAFTYTSPSASASACAYTQKLKYRTACIELFKELAVMKD